MFARPRGLFPCPRVCPRITRPSPRKDTDTGRAVGGQLNGDHWSDWLASDCPALLLRGSRSTVLSAEHAKEMAARRPRTRLVELPAGHTVHETAPGEFAAAVSRFLGSL
ncbi:alpha/beta hydrolase [Streptomyces sp. NPDC006662]|uniref:alpha/beta fold hydrolase n=1 Tax=Streptomyces sp. NPDC006662 TaxID=3156902 RepID=UPI003408E7C6